MPRLLDPPSAEGTIMEALKDSDVNFIAICRDYAERYRMMASFDVFCALWEIVHGEFYMQHIRKGSEKYQSEEAQDALSDFLSFIWKTLEENNVDLDRALD